MFITPYVLDSPEKVAEETRRRRDSLNLEGLWRQGWSGSELADPPDYVRPLPGSAGRSRAVPSQEAAPSQEAIPPEAERSRAADGDGASERTEEDEDVTAFIERQRERWRQAVQAQEHEAR